MLVSLHPSLRPASHILAFTGIALLSLAAAVRPLVAQPAGSELLAWETYRIFEAHCADCHTARVRKPKGGFGEVLDLARISKNPDYVVPGEPERSEIYRSLIDPDPDSRMPPPDSDTQPLSPGQIETVREWIAAGAGLGGGDAVPARDVKSAGQKARASLRILFARMHPLVVHFPIGLLIAGFAASGLWLAHPRFHWLEGAVRWSLWAGVAGALAAGGSGWLDATVAGYADGAVWRHRWLGIATAAVALAAAAVFELSHAMRPRRRRILIFLMLLIALVLVTLAGHTGGVLVRGENYLW